MSSRVFEFTDYPFALSQMRQVDLVEICSHCAVEIQPSFRKFQPKNVLIKDLIQEEDLLEFALCVMKEAESDSVQMKKFEREEKVRLAEIQGEV